MKSDNIIKFEVTAAPGSILEKMLHQVLKDRDDNRKRIMTDFLTRKEKIAKKLERRL